MKTKKVIFDVKDIEEAQSGYKLEVDIQKVRIKTIENILDLPGTVIN